MAAVNAAAESREAILAAAQSIMAERGIEAASLAEIATAAGLSRGTLYYYYRTKDELVLDIAERHMESLTADLVALSRSGGFPDAQGAIALLLGRVVGDDARASLHHHLMHGVFSGREGIRIKMAGTYRRWFTMLADELGRFPRPACDMAEPDSTRRVPDEALRLVVATIDGLIIQKRILGRSFRLAGEGTARALAVAMGFEGRKA